MTTRTGEGAHVARLLLAFERAPYLGGSVAGIHRHHRLLVGEENPVALLLRQLAPGPVDVVTESQLNVAETLAMPGGRPGGDGALADGECVVGHQRAFGLFVDASQTVALWTRALWRVRRERFRIQQLLPARIMAGARIQHAQQIGERGDAATR